jgi:hypothetical protein
MLRARLAHLELSASINCHRRLRTRRLPHTPTGHARGHRRACTLPRGGPPHCEPFEHLLPALMAVVETSVDHVEPRAEEPDASAASDAGKREMWDLEDLLSKLNPMIEEFVPPSFASPVGAGFPVGRGIVGFWFCRRRGEGVRRPWLP